jgi:hypothetical protein
MNCTIRLTKLMINRFFVGLSVKKDALILAYSDKHLRAYYTSTFAF